MYDYKQLLENINISINEIIDMLFDVDEVTMVIDKLCELQNDIDTVIDEMGCD